MWIQSAFPWGRAFQSYTKLVFNMKAFSIASLIALGIAGTACSQDADVKAEDTKPAEAKTEAPDVGGSFNLGLPTDAPASTAGFNLGTEVAASNGLSELPEIEAPIDAEDAPETDEDDEPIIRLE